MGESSTTFENRSFPPQTFPPLNPPPCTDPGRGGRRGGYQKLLWAWWACARAVVRDVGPRPLTKHVAHAVGCVGRPVRAQVRGRHLLAQQFVHVDALEERVGQNSLPILQALMFVSVEQLPDEVLRLCRHVWMRGGGGHLGSGPEAYERSHAGATSGVLTGTTLGCRVKPPT